MPKMSKWMENAMELLLSGSFHPVKVAKIEQYAEQLVEVSFQGDLSKASDTFVSGNVVSFQVSDTAFRHYTPSFFDQSIGLCKVIIYTHDKGPGSKYVAGLKLGDEVKLIGPRGKLTYDFSRKTHLVFGDETSLSFMKCLQEEAKRQNSTFHALVELEAAHQDWASLVGLDNAMLANKSNVGTNSPSEILEHWLSENQDHTDTFFYLTGNGDSIKPLQKILVDKGVSREQIKAKPYWLEGKEGI